jgi:hypothetical protein
MTIQIEDCRHTLPSETEIGRALARNKARSIVNVLQEGVFFFCQVTEPEAKALQKVAKYECVDLRRLAGGVVELNAYVELPTVTRMLAILRPASEHRQSLH